MNILAPIDPRDLDERLRFGLEAIVRKIIHQATRDWYKGDNLLLRIYMAGMYHAAEIGTDNGEKND